MPATVDDEKSRLHGSPARIGEVEIALDLK
jgi:hypothetical protein